MLNEVFILNLSYDFILRFIDEVVLNPYKIKKCNLTFLNLKNKREWLRMKISEIKEGMTNVSLEAKIVEKEERRSVRTKYGRRDVANLLLEDETGNILLTLWGEMIDEFDVGDKVKISGAFVTEFKDELYINVPRRSGKIEKI